MGRKNLANLVFVGFLGFTSGCEMRVNPVGIENAATILAHKPIQDVDGDNKPDIVYAVNIYYRMSLSGGEYDDHSHIFYRRNLGDGKFDNPRYLFSSSDCPPAIPKESLVVGRSNEEKGLADFYIGLIKEANKNLRVESEE